MYYYADLSDPLAEELCRSCACVVKAALSCDGLDAVLR